MQAQKSLLTKLWYARNVDHIDECLNNPLNDDDRRFLEEKLALVRGKEFF